MTSIFRRTTAVVVAAAMLAGAFLIALPAMAQDNPTTGSGLRISPTRNELSIVPGDSREVIQTVRNVTQSPVSVEPTLNDFESDGVTGEPKLIGDPEVISAFSLRGFIDLPESFELQPDEEIEVKIGLNVPANASPGAYFGSVLYRAVPLGDQGDGQVALIASVGSLVLLEVPGEITEKIQINDVSAFIQNDDETYSSGSLFTKKPDAIGVEIENLGNSFSQPFGKVSVKDWRGNEVFSYELNRVSSGAPRGNILPESTRLFIDELYNVEVKTVNGEEVTDKTSPITWPGRYEVVGNISHGTSGEIFTVSTSFWYIPGWLIVLAIVLVVGLVVLAYYLYRKYVTKPTKRK